MTVNSPSRGVTNTKASKGPMLYEHKTVVTFGDTNAEGNMGHDRYASLFGKARELLALEFIPNFKNEAGKTFLLKTRSANYDYRRDFFFGDRISVRMTVTEVNHASFSLKAEFVNEETDAVHAVGEQLIAYADMNGKPVKLPKELKDLLLMVVEVSI
jgi:acyl-CoA thioesterase FadM